jgi:hypothetical protein
MHTNIVPENHLQALSFEALQRAAVDGLDGQTA